MIIGTGADILATSEVKKSFKKMGWAFVHQILGPIEVEVFAEIDDLDEKVMYLARRLAAKEAIVKALDVKVQDIKKIHIVNNLAGHTVAFYPEASDIRFHLTISDCGDYVMAVVVCERI